MKTGVEKIGRTVTVERAQRGCLDKNRYPKKTSARDEALRIAARHPEWRPLRPYKCGICSGWHLTSHQPFGLTRRPKDARAQA